LWIPYRRNHAVKIEAYTDYERNSGGNKNDGVDLQDEVTKTPKEKYDGDMN
jgi:hypothetical protein